MFLSGAHPVRQNREESVMAINVTHRVHYDNVGVEENLVGEDGWADKFYMTPEASKLDTVNGGGGIDNDTSNTAVANSLISRRS